MSRQEPDNTNDTSPKKYPFWPDSMQREDYYQTRDQVRPNFVSSLQKALLALAKVAGQAFIFLFASVVFPLIFLLIYGEEDSQRLLFISSLILLIAITVSVFLSARIFEGVEPVELGLKLNRQAMQHIFVGWIISFSVLALQFWLYLELGLVEVMRFSWQDVSFSVFFWNLVIAFLIPMFAGWSQELLFRGYYLRILTDGFGRFNAILLTAVFSAYLPFIFLILVGSFVINLFVFHFLFALLMTFAFLRTGQLWLPMGIHTGWSFFGGVVFANTSMFSVNLFHVMDVTSRVTLSQALTTDIIGLAMIAFLIKIYTSHQQTSSKGAA